MEAARRKSGGFARGKGGHETNRAVAAEGPNDRQAVNVHDSPQSRLHLGQLGRWQLGRRVPGVSHFPRCLVTGGEEERRGTRLCSGEDVVFENAVDEPLLVTCRFEANEKPVD